MVIFIVYLEVYTSEQRGYAADQRTHNVKKAEDFALKAFFLVGLLIL